MPRSLLDGPPGLPVEIRGEPAVVRIENAEGEGVLPGQVGLHAEVPDGAAGHHGIVVITEH